MAWLMRRWRLWRLRRLRAWIVYWSATQGKGTTGKIHRARARIAWHESLLTTDLPRAKARKVA